ncbi:MAG: HlyD family efflux transporter periplasmic adaptor subunit [Anaerolineae bacterium]|nr:HlyD family efflux transporter periplasmic adaptor subunit [Anaerolineae bacterium]
MRLFTENHTGLVRPARMVVVFAALFAGLLTACAPAAEEEATPDAAAQASASLVSATGEVVPEMYASLAFATGGEVVEILVEEGDVVTAGTPLLRLDTAPFEAGVLQAEAALASAEANFARVEAGPREEEIRAAENALAAANARTSAAVANRDALRSGVSEQAILQAQTALAQAEDRYNETQAQMEWLLALAEQQGWGNGSIAPGERNPLSAGEPLANQIDLLELQVAAAQARLTDLTDGPDPDQLAVANARIALAAAQRDAAAARLELTRTGASEQEIAIAQAQVAQAQAGLDAARARLNQASLVAPFNGTVSGIAVILNQFVAPGQAVIDLGDLSGLQIRTTDLNEIDVARVQVEDLVTIKFDALPDVTTTGRVIRISPKSEAGTGVNYTVTIAMDEIPENVRWGMTAFVDIQVNR